MKENLNLPLTSPLSDPGYIGPSLNVWMKERLEENLLIMVEEKIRRDQEMVDEYKKSLKSALNPFLIHNRIDITLVALIPLLQTPVSNIAIETAYGQVQH